MNKFIRHIEEAIPQNLAEVSTRLKYVFVTLFVVLAGVVSFNGTIFPSETASMVPSIEETAAMATAEAASAESAEREMALVHPSELEPVPAEQVSQQTLWLARCIYSETKRPEEQELVAWAIRNRVETGYRGEHTYRDVVLDPYQFSAFNPGSRKRSYLMNLTPADQAKGWQQAIAIADRVISSPAAHRPFSKSTRHYYSRRSMPGGSQPNWARGERPTDSDRGYGVDPDRFRFYAGIR